MIKNFVVHIPQIFLFYFQVIATLVAVFVVDKFGRKPLLAFSSSVMCISIIALGTFFYLDENKRCDNTQTGLSHPLTHSKNFCINCLLHCTGR